MATLRAALAELQHRSAKNGTPRAQARARTMVAQPWYAIGMTNDVDPAIAALPALFVQLRAFRAALAAELEAHGRATGQTVSAAHLAFGPLWELYRDLTRRAPHAVPLELEEGRRPGPVELMPDANAIAEMLHATEHEEERQRFRAEHFRRWAEHLAAVVEAVDGMPVDLNSEPPAPPAPPAEPTPRDPGPPPEADPAPSAPRTRKRHP
jgi:hypothetical protein